MLAPDGGVSWCSDLFLGRSPKPTHLLHGCVQYPSAVGTLNAAAHIGGSNASADPYISGNPFTMRTTITIVIAFMHCMAFGQITLEHTYPNAGYFFSYGQLMMVDLEVSGMSYVEIDRANKEIKLFHLDHTLFKTVSFAAATPPWPNFGVTIMYISEHLFDQDDDLEFMYVLDLPKLTQVYNEDGSLLLDEPDAVPYVRQTIHNQQYPIYNTNDGAKLILSHADSTAKVYSLGGTLTVGMATSGTEQFQQLAANRAFPNPTSSQINFTLASMLQQNGELIISDVTGRVVQTLPIAQGTSQVTQDVSDLPDGAYLYRLTSGGIPFTSGTFVRAR